jgi:hypothetical protein
MRVIKHGVLYEKGPVKCFNCFCEFTYCDRDIHKERIDYTDDYGSLDYKEIKGVHCPECNTVVEVKGE